MVCVVNLGLHKVLNRITTNTLQYMLFLTTNLLSVTQTYYKKTPYMSTRLGGI